MMHYVPHTLEDRKAMLSAMGLNDIDDLFMDVDPSILNPKMDIEDAIDPIRINHHMDALGQRNTHGSYLSFLGGGAYDHFVPACIDPLVSRGEFLTAYTPYQPEMSQGLLQAIFEYQTMICELTGMDVSNASLYDGSTAIWEAILMSMRVNKRRKVIVLGPINPAYADVVRTHAYGADVEIVDIACKDSLIDRIALLEQLDDSVASVVHQYPNYFGSVEDVRELSKACADLKTLWISVVNPLALTQFESPAEMGADIIIGEGQPLGVPLSFGGPYFGFMGTRQKYVRQLPGRICGETKDLNADRGYVLTIQTREQHIRREKATSNICTNQSLLALRSAIYMAYMGFEGMRQVAEASRKRLQYLLEGLQAIEGVSVYSRGDQWCEAVIHLPCYASEFLKEAEGEGIVAGHDLSEAFPEMTHHLLVCVTENKTREDIDVWLATLKKSLEGKLAQV